MTGQRPMVGQPVHYVSRGSADGRFPATCRAAIVTEVGETPGEPERALIGLCAVNPTGLFFHALDAGGCDYNDGLGKPGVGDCPVAGTHGAPFRYCACGWTEPHLVGGTWHWPENSD